MRRCAAPGRPGGLRLLSSVAGLVLLAALAAACGQREQQPDRSADATAQDLARGTWVLRIDGHSGPDGETTTASYLMVRPADASVRTVSTAPVDAGDTSGVERALLLDAGHRLALADTSPSDADTARGRARVTTLADGATHEVDVRRATRDASLRTDHVAFDPTRPGLLRVVSGRQLWAVQLSADGDPTRAARQATVPITDSWIFGGFGVDTGKPYLSSISSFATRPKGYGELDRQVLRRGDGRVLTADDDPGGSTSGTPQLAGEPADPTCDQVTGFVEKGGRAWEFCLKGTDLSVKIRAEGRPSWTTVGPQALDVVPAEHDLAFVLPPAG